MKNAFLVDVLGVLLAVKAALEKQIGKLKEGLRDNGDGAYEGFLFRATVSTSVSYRLDLAAVRAKLSPQFISAHEIPVPKITVRVSSRSNVGVLESA